MSWVSSLLCCITHPLQLTPKSNLPQSVKVREGYVKGNVKQKAMIVELPQSVKVREGYAKGNVKQKERDDFTAVREGPWRLREG